MTPAQFARVESLFERACEQPRGRRAAWLHEQCADDPEVLRKVEGMLEHDDRSVAALDTPALGADFHVGNLDEDERRLRDEFVAAGRYRIEALLGEGGFGRVYRAEQREPVQRIVALKVIKLGMDTRQILARFAAERQTLAMMNHPHIARFLDAGATASGRSYFVMELIDGEPITSYCDKRGLEMRSRLELFSQVCGAIRHAHQKGVLHRDIKPSNVLVAVRDGNPWPVVIDFGIARALDDDSWAVSAVTAQGQMIGTPEYMSPEQAEGSRDIDTRTDVYSLGVLLYELLTGLKPFERAGLGDTSLAQLQRLIRVQVALAPSTRVRRTRERGGEARANVNLLRGDLDAIVMKAIEKERARRYQTVEAFAADVERYLASEPVLARPQSRSYRFRKFARRHRASLAAALVIVALLLAAIAGTTYGMVKAQQEARVAREESAIAKAVTDFLNEDLLTAMDHQRRGHDVGMKEILDVASTRIESRFVDQPRVELAIRCSLGRAYKYLGDYPTAGHHLERAAVLARLPGGVAEANRVEALLVLADVRNLTGRPAEAEPLLQEALAEGIRLEGDTGPFPLLIMNSLAQTHRQLHQLDEAEALYRRIIEIRRGLSDQANNQRELLTTMSNLAALCRYSGDYEQMDAVLVELVDRARRSLGADDPVTIKSEFDFAHLRRVQGRLDDADALLTPLLARMRKKMGEEHPGVSFATAELAKLRFAQDRKDEALELMLKAVDLQRQTLGEAHEATQDSVGALVTFYETLQRPGEASAWRARLVNAAPAPSPAGSTPSP